jgi:hypothetical protein
MTMRLNKLGYQQLIDEDIAWLEKIPRTLERDHIISVLRASVTHGYPEPHSVLPIDKDDERIVDALVAKRTKSLGTKPLRGFKPSDLKPEPCEAHGEPWCDCDK